MGKTPYLTGTALALILLAGAAAAAPDARARKLLADWNTKLDAAATAIQTGDLAAARSAVNSAGRIQVDCVTSSSCRDAPEFAGLKARTQELGAQTVHAKVVPPAANTPAAAPVNATATAPAIPAPQTAAPAAGPAPARVAQRAAAGGAPSERAAEDALMNARSQTLYLNRVQGGGSYASGGGGDEGKTAFEMAQRIDKEAQALREALASYAQAVANADQNPFYAQAKAQVAAVPASHKATQDHLLTIYQSGLKTIETHIHATEKAQRFDALAADVAFAVQIDPGHKALQDFNASLAERKGGLLQAMQAKVDAGVWPKRSAFAGPGSADELEKAALQTLRNDRSWGKNTKRPQEILAVVVQGPWQAAERDALGRIISWRVPMKVAVTDAKLKPQGVAQVYDISMVTPQANGKKQELPFDGAWVGGNYYMRLNKLP